MRARFIALFSMVTLISSQTPQAFGVPALPAAQTATAAGAATPGTQAPGTPTLSTQTLTVPAGTSIPLTLINPIKKKSTKPGDAVRATVAFPIMAGMVVAVPAGSYVEGVVKTVTARASDTHQPEVGIHFTRLVFTNGYSVNLDANSAQAEEVAPGLGTPGVELASLTPAAGGMGLFAQTTPPPPPHVGPPMGVVMGATFGGAAAFTILAFALTHHSQSKIDFVLFDAGWQFQMQLQSPLVIDASQAIGASAPPSGN